MKILFLCTGNSCRSQMAEAILNQLGRGRFEAFSAGSKPAGFVHPFAISSLQENGYSGENLRSKSLEEFRGRRFDLVITVCDSAQEACPSWPGAVMIHWNFTDPAEALGSTEDKMRTFRKVFNEIEAAIRKLIAQKETEAK